MNLLIYLVEKKLIIRATKERMIAPFIKHLIAKSVSLSLLLQLSVE